MVELILFWDGGSPAPTDWSSVAEGADDFDRVFIRGNSTYQTGQGSSNHQHDISLVSCTGPSTTTRLDPNSTSCADDTHTHGVGTISHTAKSNSPLYRRIYVIKHDSTDTPEELPSGVIAIFDAAVSTGWTRYSDQDTRLPFGTALAIALLNAGDSTHTHDLSGNTSSAIGALGLVTGTADTDTVLASETHTYSKTTNSGDSMPPYIKVYFYKKDSAGEIPVGMIGMFNGTPNSSFWDVLSNSGGDFHQFYFIGNNGYDTNSGAGWGAATHSHTVDSATTGAAGFTLQQRGGTDMAKSAHTHDMVTAADATSSLPMTTDVIIAKFKGYTQKGPIPHLDNGPHPRSRASFMPTMTLNMG